jgi:hypothetical protein
MKIDAYFVGENTIKAFLTKYGKGYKSKDHEYAIAVYVKRIFEKVWGIECCIGLELKEPFSAPKGADLSPLEIVNEVLRKKTKEDTPIDFAIVKGNTKKHEADGFAFQLKRFGMDIRDNFKTGLVSYITEEIPSKTGKCENIGLIIVLDPDENLNEEELQNITKNFGLKAFSKSFKIDTYPYEKIYLLGKDPNVVHLTEIWPKFSQFTLPN